MAKGYGLDSHFAIGGIDLTGDTASINNLSSPRGTFVKRGLDRKAEERIYGKTDGSIGLTSYYNPAVNQAHAKYKTLPTTDQDLMAAFSGSIGGWGAAMRALQINYDGTRDADGDFLLNVDAQASAGVALDHGRLVTAWPRTDTSATNGAGVDFGSGSMTFGLRAWLQVFSFTGTSVTVKLQESSDNGVGDAWADVVGGGFTAATAAGVQRIATATNLTVERYLRAVTTGTFSSASFVVLVSRFEATPL